MGRSPAYSNRWKYPGNFTAGHFVDSGGYLFYDPNQMSADPVIPGYDPGIGGEE